LREGKARLVAKVEFKPGQGELAVAFVVVNDGLVVKLRGTQAQGVIATRVEHQEMMIIEKLFDERFLAWRYIAKRRSSGDVIKPLSSLSHGSGLHCQTELPINAGQFIGQVFTSKNLAGQLLPSPVECGIHSVFSV
jgi:hypothetical protein